MPRLDFSTPATQMMAQILGSVHYEGAEFSLTQYKQLCRLYGVTDAKREEMVAESRAMHEGRVASYNEDLQAWKAGTLFQEPEAPKPFDEAGIRRWYERGDARNMFRHAQHDGLRVMAFLSRFLEPGEDPVKMLIQMAVDAGFDVDPSDIEWGCNDETE